jgi:hypothetical protein
MLLKTILSNVEGMREILEENEAEYDLMHVWDRICFRLDIGALVITQIINGYLLILWFTNV